MFWGLSLFTLRRIRLAPIHVKSRDVSIRKVDIVRFMHLYKLVILIHIPPAKAQFVQELPFWLDFIKFTRTIATFPK